MRANNVENGGAHRQAIGTCHVLVPDLLDGSLHQGGTVRLRIGPFLLPTWIVALVLAAFHIWMALRTGSEKRYQVDIESRMKAVMETKTLG